MRRNYEIDANHLLPAIRCATVVLHRARDTLVAITASRRTPYAVAGLQYARQVGASTVFITCNDPPAEVVADVVIAAVVGPEVVTGSTRMKAGTAQKLVLNMISTAAMIRLGKVYENLMVDLRPMSQKLEARSNSSTSYAERWSP